MTCEVWEDIKDLLESIIDNGELKFGKYMKYIDAKKRLKNLKTHKHFDKKNNGYKLILTEDMSDTEIAEWCKELNLPDYLCVNEIKSMNTSGFIEKYGINIICKTFYQIKKVELEEINKLIDITYSMNKTEIDDTKLNHITQVWIEKREKYFKEHGFYVESVKNDYKKLNKKELEQDNGSIIRFSSKFKDERTGKEGKRLIHTCYDDNENLYICVSFITNKKELYTSTNDYINKTPYMVNGDVVKYSVLKEEYIKNNDGYSNEDGDDFIEDGGLPSKYYWKTPDGWLYLFDKDGPEIFSINIVGPSKIPLAVVPANISTIPLINSDVILFTNTCCKVTDKPNLRFGLKEIYSIYENWCKLNNKKCLKTQKKLKEELEKLNYNEEKSKGLDINNNPGKRGYNIMVAL